LPGSIRASRPNNQAQTRLRIGFSWHRNLLCDRSWGADDGWGRRGETTPRKANEVKADWPAIPDPTVVPVPMSPAALDTGYRAGPIPAELLEDDDRMPGAVRMAGRGPKEMSELPLGPARQRPIHAVLGFEQHNRRSRRRTRPSTRRFRKRNTSATPKASRLARMKLKKLRSNWVVDFACVS
jgi:hypothetical protein